MTESYFTEKVREDLLLELSEEADRLRLKSGDAVEVSIRVTTRGTSEAEAVRTQTPQERAQAFRAWAESHSHTTPLLSDDAISRESLYRECR